MQGSKAQNEERNGERRAACAKRVCSHGASGCAVHMLPQCALDDSAEVEGLPAGPHTSDLPCRERPQLVRPETIYLAMTLNFFVATGAPSLVTVIATFQVPPIARLPAPW